MVNSCGRKRVFVDGTYFDSYDSKYVIGAIRDAFTRAGALLMTESPNLPVAGSHLVDDNGNSGKEKEAVTETSSRFSRGGINVCQPPNKQIKNTWGFHEPSDAWKELP
jgi:hypothetical protein